MDPTKSKMPPPFLFYADTVTRVNWKKIYMDASNAGNCNQKQIGRVILNGPVRCDRMAVNTNHRNLPRRRLDI